ncbi:response regulator transcription factor [Actinomadura fulvescens]|uniref:Response regulator transcription factor n=1 Tax=Actinomadura fulvescens TaxID=46160 RepID=A0ABN3Q6H9_9ACTN
MLVVDDQVLIRAGLAALIRAAPGLTVAGEAETGEDAVRLAAAHRPDVILMDVRLPGISGIAATERILAAGGNGDSEGAAPPKVLILTTFDLDEYVYEGIRAGASGFLLKDTPPERLLTAIRTVAAGDILLSPAALRRLLETFTTPRSSAAPELAALTRRETEVLALVARAHTNREIAETLSLSEATVKTHLNRVMAKLSLTSRAQAVAVAYDYGLVTPRSPR